jgi:hypothetical protein
MRLKEGGRCRRWAHLYCRFTGDTCALIYAGEAQGP